MTRSPPPTTSPCPAPSTSSPTADGSASRSGSTSRACPAAAPRSSSPSSSPRGWGRNYTARGDDSVVIVGRRHRLPALVFGIMTGRRTGTGSGLVPTTTSFPLRAAPQSRSRGRLGNAGGYPALAPDRMPTRCASSDRTRATAAVTAAITPSHPTFSAVMTAAPTSPDSEIARYSAAPLSATDSDVWPLKLRIRYVWGALTPNPITPYAAAATSAAGRVVLQYGVNKKTTTRPISEPATTGRPPTRSVNLSQ